MKKGPFTKKEIEEIYKRVIGTEVVAYRDEATLDYILEKNNAIFSTAKNIATKHPFIDGNKRVAFVLIEVHNLMLVWPFKGSLEKVMKRYKDWIKILEKI